MCYAFDIQICTLLYIGTSTDVSRYAGAVEHVFETTIAGVTIQAPQVFNFFDSISYFDRL